MRVVVDTNVVVSGLLNPYRTCASILRLIIDKKVEIVLDVRIIIEYYQVLQRPKFPFLQYQIDDFLEGIKDAGIIVVSSPLKKDLPDPADNLFLEAALVSKADFLITGNIKHYPSEICKKIKVVTPADFIKAYRK